MRGMGGQREREPAGAGELIKLAAARENNESNFSITENGEFISFLHQTISSLGESHLSINLVFDSLQLHFSSPHFFNPQLKKKSKQC